MPFLPSFSVSLVFLLFFTVKKCSRITSVRDDGLYAVYPLFLHLFCISYHFFHCLPSSITTTSPFLQFPFLPTTFTFCVSILFCQIFFLCSSMMFHFQGDPVWDASLQVKVLPVDLLFQKEVKGGAFEPHKITSVSINKELLRCGLALPVRWVVHAFSHLDSFHYSY